MYVTVKYKLYIAFLAAIGWCSLSVYLGLPWIYELTNTIGEFYPNTANYLAIAIVTGLAFIPGFMNSYLIMGLISDKRPVYISEDGMPRVSVLIAAYNEEEHIGETIDSIMSQEYDGFVEIMVIDDGSEDNTATRVAEKKEEYKDRKNRLIRLNRLMNNGGKANALNKGLEGCLESIVVTVDADSCLYKGSLTNIVNNLVHGPEKTAAVAGTVLVRNSRHNWITKLQEWDYFLGISVVKRVQSLFQGTMVAQGAFSAYYKDAIKDVGGWKNTVGEDIVLTWGLHEKGYRVAYAENAFCFTNVPTTYNTFYEQRKRWSRGLVEAFKSHPKVLVRPRMNTPFVYFNLMFPYIDFLFLFVFVPNIFLAIFLDFYAIVGLMTLTLLPLMILLNWIMFIKQRTIFSENELEVRANKLGFVSYMLFYQMLLAPACLMGYILETIGAKKRWGTS